MKRFVIALSVLLCLTATGWSQDDPKNSRLSPLQLRYSYEADLKLYAQKTPKDTLESIIRAIIDQRPEYMLAQLADPEYVDGKVSQYMRALSRADNLRGSMWAAKLGANVTPPEEKLKLNLGLVLDRVMIGSPAARAGLKDADVVIQLNNAPIASNPVKLLLVLDELKDGTKVYVQVLRNGKMEMFRGLIIREVDNPHRMQAFQQLVRETTNLYFEDAERIQELRMFAREAEWKIEGDQAIGTLKKFGNRRVFMRLREDRWFLENRQSKER